MISFTPWYIILGEFGIALAFALLARTVRRGSWRQAVVAGMAGGFSIFVCYALAFWITDRLLESSSPAQGRSMSVVQKRPVFGYDSLRLPPRLTIRV